MAGSVFCIFSSFFGLLDNVLDVVFLAVLLGFGAFGDFADQFGAVGEGVDADVCDGGGDDDLFQVLAEVDGKAFDCFYAFREGDGFDGVAVPDHAAFNGLEVLGEAEGGQAAAAGEGVLADFLYGVGKDNGFQLIAVLKGTHPDNFDAFRDFKGACVLVHMEDDLMLLFVDQHIVLHFEDRVGRIDVNGL